MDFQLFSDLHCEFIEYNRGISGLNEFIDMLPVLSKNLVLAGDICSTSQIVHVLERFKRKWENVIYIRGNHEYYGTSFNEPESLPDYKIKDIKDVHCLENELIVLDGQRILAGTMWFPNDPNNVLYERRWSDFENFRGARNYIYPHNEAFVKFIEENIQEGDVVITHYLPSYQSVASRFKGSHYNRFFVCDMEKLIVKAKPKLWMHAHTHDSFDYMLADTRVVCNPFGYDPSDLNPNFKEDLLIEL